MTCHGQWFETMRPMDVKGYVEMGDDMQHAITHVGSVPLVMHNGEVYVKYIICAFNYKEFGLYRSNG